MAVELYHFWSSVCSVRCRMALEEKGVPWTSRYIDIFKFDQMRPEYLAINPRGMVQTLVHDGKPVRLRHRQADNGEIHPAEAKEPMGRR
ncbi:MAG: glutathione S-transferase N-terminal domain-containing protein [Xanthobacteraceae bacterium]